MLREPTYLIARKGTRGQTIADHAQQRWIAGCERCRSHLLRSCDRARFTPDIGITTDDYVAVQSFVAAGLGVATLPALALTAHRHPGVRATLLSGDGRRVFAAVHGQAPDPPVTAALLAHLVAAGSYRESAAARPAARPEKRHPPRKVPSKAL